MHGRLASKLLSREIPTPLTKFIRPRILIDAAAAARDYVAVLYFIVLVVNFLPAHSSTSYITEYYSNDSYKQEVFVNIILYRPRMP